MQTSKKRIVILTEGHTDLTSGKTAAGVLRYRRDEIVAFLDSTQAGRDVSELLGFGHGVPIVATLLDTLQFEPDTLFIGISPSGGILPESWRTILFEAIEHGLDIVAGLHMFLGDDPELSERAEKYGVSIRDLRKVPDDLTVNKCTAKEQKCFRVHTVGTDCNCGKKLATLEINRALKEMGKDCLFIATGQTGIMISGKGIALDRVIADFVAGAAERLVLENAEHEYLLIEGQGALAHPLYSGVTLSMIHGFAPQALILCHEYGRDILRGTKDTPMPSIEQMIPLYESVAEPVFPAKVIGIALNTRVLSEQDAQREVARLEESTGLPATDVIRFDPEKLARAVLEFEKV